MNYNVYLDGVITIEVFFDKVNLTPRRNREKSLLVVILFCLIQKILLRLNYNFSSGGNEKEIKVIDELLDKHESWLEYHLQHYQEFLQS